MTVESHLSRTVARDVSEVSDIGLTHMVTEIQLSDNKISRTILGGVIIPSLVIFPVIAGQYIAINFPFGDVRFELPIALGLLVAFVCLFYISFSYLNSLMIVRNNEIELLRFEVRRWQLSLENQKRTVKGADEPVAQVG